MKTPHKGKINASIIDENETPTRAKNSKTTEIYTHVSKKALDKIVSPLDRLNINITGDDK